MKTLLVAVLATFYIQLALAGPATFGLSPDNSRDLLVSTIESAEKELLINIYEFQDWNILDVIGEQIEAGITVQILIEGNPWAYKNEGQEIVRELQSLMAASKNPRNRIYLMTKPESGEKRRFKLNHAKYIVADGKKAWISSENFSPNALPKQGSIGNRGWQVVMEDTHIVRELTALFKEDTLLKYGDVLDVTRNRDPNGPRRSQEREAERRKVPSLPQGHGEVRSASLITSPDAVAALSQVIKGARKNLELEYMSLPSTWNEQGKHQSPLVGEVIHAARRGVEVRVLLNDPATFDRSSSQDDASSGRPVKVPANELTVEILKQIARCEQLPLAARIVDVKATGIRYIHNKGMLIDGEKALISSINGTKDSVKNNREVAVLLDSTDAAEYFGEAFEFDWSSSPDRKAEVLTRCLQRSPTDLFSSETRFFLEEAFAVSAVAGL